jgi:hypothetical protein
MSSRPTIFLDLLPRLLLKSGKIKTIGFFHTKTENNHQIQHLDFLMNKGRQIKMLMDYIQRAMHHAKGRYHHPATKSSRW